jgi:hypothetical protein
MTKHKRLKANVRELTLAGDPNDAEKSETSNEAELLFNSSTFVKQSEPPAGEFCEICGDPGAFRMGADILLCSECQELFGKRGSHD